MALIGQMNPEKNRFGIQESPQAERGLPVREAESRACTAELAECTCPDFCERDHDND
jgi:hypothetical protein